MFEYNQEIEDMIREQQYIQEFILGTEEARYYFEQAYYANTGKDSYRIAVAKLLHPNTNELIGYTIFNNEDKYTQNYSLYNIKNYFSERTVWIQNLTSPYNSQVKLKELNLNKR